MIGRHYVSVTCEHLLPLVLQSVPVQSMMSEVHVKKILTHLINILLTPLVYIFSFLGLLFPRDKFHPKGAIIRWPALFNHPSEVSDFILLWEECPWRERWWMLAPCMIRCWMMRSATVSFFLQMTVFHLNKLYRNHDYSLSN